MPSPELIDISRPLAATTAGWPGDVPYRYTLGWSQAAGSSVNVGAVETSVHAGTHCDAPFHYAAAGATADRLPLDAFLGPCRVVEVPPGCDDWLALVGAVDAPRVVFRTGGWPDSARFPDRIPTIRPDHAAALAAAGLRLFGVDLPSVDPLDSKTLDVHHALGRYGVAILEGLWLDGVPAGRYELIALPLPLVGADGSPVRAVLRRLDPQWVGPDRGLVPSPLAGEG